MAAAAKAIIITLHQNFKASDLAIKIKLMTKVTPQTQPRVTRTVNNGRKNLWEKFICGDFLFQVDPCLIQGGGRVMTYTAVRHRGAIEMVWLHFLWA